MVLPDAINKKARSYAGLRLFFAVLCRTVPDLRSLPLNSFLVHNRIGFIEIAATQHVLVPWKIPLKKVLWKSQACMS